MAKRKPKPKTVPAPEPGAPRNAYIKAALLQDALAKITDDKVNVFVSFLFSPDKSKTSAAQRKAQCMAMMDFAALGWAYFQTTTIEED